jgi:hypothetical protein
MSMLGATILAAVATAVLALFAIVTAWYARKAFLKQSQEVLAIEQQVSDQKELTARQADLLKVQADQLKLQQQEYGQQQEDRRLDQASRVFMWAETGPDPAISQVQRTTTPGTYEMVAVHVKNTSGQPVYDLTINWRKGTAPWDEPDHLAVLMPDQQQNFTRALPDNLPPGVDRSLYSAVVIFRDRNQAWWRTRPDGRFEELPPGSEPPHSW